MTWWPGWDSIGNSAWWSQFWFGISLVSLFVFGATQVISQVYGLRKSELVALDNKARQAHLVQERPTKILRPPPISAQDRHLSQRQRQIIVDTLKLMTNIRLSLVLLEDHEAASFGEELLSAMQEAGVTLTALSRRNVLLPAPVGVRIWYKQDNPAAETLLRAFQLAEISIAPMVGRLGDQEAHIVVGVKGSTMAAAQRLH